MRLVLLLALAACATNPPLDTTPAGVRDLCGAAQHQDLVGQPREAVSERSFRAERVRLISPGMAVTMDFLPDRLNIFLGEDDRVRELRCG